MVPKLHAKGSSFRGLVAGYLLRGKDGAEKADRVAWTSTRNLATDDPQLAWRLCAAVAMDAPRLKEKAGVKNTGRRSTKSVAHLSLAWHPERDGEVDRAEMERAADLAIKALGAESYQAMIIAHSDGHPHVHIVINRVNPSNGKMLCSSMERLKLSKFALDYERERGEILCPARALNWAGRDRGEYVRGKKDVPRHIYEHRAANQNRPDKAEHHRRQRDKDQKIGKQQRAIRDRQAAEWIGLEERHREARAAIIRQKNADVRRAVSDVQKRFRETRWADLRRAQETELAAFERNEASFLGRMKNRARAVDFRGLIGSGGKARAIGEAFNALSSAGVRRTQLLADHSKQQAALLAKQRSEERRAAKTIRDDARSRLSEAGLAFQAERASLVLKTSLEAAKMRAEWKQRASERAQDRTPDDPAARRAELLKQVFERKSRERDRDGGDYER